MFQNFNSLNKKKIENLIEKTKENIKDNKSMFYSFSKDFKMNFNEGLLKTVDWYLENITWMEKK